MKKNLGKIALWAVLLFIGIAAIPQQAHASSSGGGGSGLPYEAPLQKLETSVTGPVAFGIATIALVGCIGTLIFGGELNGLLKTLLFVVIGCSLMIGATNVISFMGGSGADIRSSSPLSPPKAVLSL